MYHQDLEGFYLGTLAMEPTIIIEGHAEATALPRPMVLILEDFDAIRAWTSHHLEQKGYDVYSAATLHDAIQIAKEAEPQLVLIDYDMSGEDAIWAVGQLRGLAPHAFILVLGGPGTTSVEHHAIEAGASQVLAHAYDVQLLDEILQHNTHGLAGV
jgi:DNA-binding response OmpR family regulator